MQLASEVLDGVEEARSRPIDGIADDRESAMLDGVEKIPAGTCSESFDILSGLLGVAVGKDEVFRLEAHYFLEAYLGPILRIIHE